MDEDVKILCVDDEKNVLRSLKRLFIDDDYEIFTASDGETGLEILSEEPDIQLIISDYRMPGMDGVEFLRKAFELNPATIRIVLSGYADTASVVAAINEGQIYKFIPKPWNDDELKVTIDKALEVYFLQRKNEAMAERLMEMNEELQAANDNLEGIVAERTAELLFQNQVMTFSHNVVDSLPAAVIGLDMSGLIVLGNIVAQDMFKDGKSPLVGSSASQVLPPEINDAIGEAKEGNSVEISWENSGRVYQVRAHKFVSDDGQEGLVVVLF